MSNKTVEMIVIGKVVAPVGIKGEVKVYSYSDDSSRFSRLQEVFLEGFDEAFDVEKSRPSGTTAVVKLKGIENRNQAEGLRGKAVMISEEDLEELPEGTYYVRDLVGLKVINLDTEEVVGTLTEVIQNTAQDVYRIKLDEETYGQGKPDALVPAVKEFIKEVDLKKGIIRIRFIEGMIEQ